MLTVFNFYNIVWGGFFLPCGVTLINLAFAFNSERFFAPVTHSGSYSTQEDLWSLQLLQPPL